MHVAERNIIITNRHKFKVDSVFYKRFANKITYISGVLSNEIGKNPLTVQGKFAQFAYVSLYRMHQHALHGCIKIGLIILVDKLNHYLKPRLKLH